MIGIDISDRSIKIAEVVNHKSRPRLRTVCWSAIPAELIQRGIIQDVPNMASALNEAFSKCSPVPTTSDMIVASIPETQSFVRVMEMPDMEDRETEEAVQWAVKQHIPFDLDRMYIDWQPLEGVDAVHKRRQILVGAVQKDVVDPLLQVLDSLGLQVVGLELEAQAIARSLLPRESQDIRGIVIVDLGATSTNVIYFDAGVMRFTTSIQYGGDDLTNTLAQQLKLEPSLAAEKKAIVGVETYAGQDARVAQTLHNATAELLRKVERVVREMAAQLQADYAVRAILLSGGAANLPGIQNVFAEIFPGIPVQLGNPWTNLAVEGREEKMPLSLQDASHFVTALGLALREPEE